MKNIFTICIIIAGLATYLHNGSSLQTDDETKDFLIENYKYNTIKKDNSISFSNNEKFVYDKNIGNLNAERLYPNKIKIFGEKTKEVYLEPNVVYFGIDLSYSKISKSGKTEDGEKKFLKIKKNVNSSLGDINANNYRRWMRKDNVFQGTNISLNYKYMNLNEFIVNDCYELTIGDINKIVKAYVLNENEGIGMVHNVSNYYLLGKSNDKYVSMYTTFFDIKTREVLFAVLSTYLLTGSYSAFFGIGKMAREVFIDEIYLKGITRTDQLPDKYK